MMGQTVPLEVDLALGRTALMKSLREEAASAVEVVLVFGCLSPCHLSFGDFVVVEQECRHRRSGASVLLCAPVWIPSWPVIGYPDGCEAMMVYAPQTAFGTVDNWKVPHLPQPAATSNCPRLF